QDILIDFIIYLSTSLRFNIILIMIDYLIKIRHFIFYKGIYNAKKTIYLYIYYI
ncbi:hypothetical protein BGW36DRAFT_309879, partial [Talaromyces proteolyticus]